MAICKNNARKQYFISYYEKQPDGSLKKINITNSEWKLTDVTKKYMQSIEAEEIKKDKLKRDTIVLNKKSKDVTLKEAVALFLDYERGQMLDEDTIYNYVLAYNNYLYPIISENTKIQDSFLPMKVSKFRTNLVGSKVSSSTINNKMVALKKLIDYCRKMKLVDRDICLDAIDMLEPVKKIKDNKEESNFFQNGQEDIDKFFASFKEEDSEWEIPLKVMFYGALRIGEWLAITPNDLDFEHATITIDKQCDIHGNIKHTTKGREERTVHIPNKIMTEISLYVAQNSRNGNELLFKSGNGNHISRTTTRRIIVKHCKMAGIEKITPHGLRHSMATRMFDKGYDVKTVQEQLGHATMNTTMTYYIHHTKGKGEDYDKLA